MAAPGTHVAYDEEGRVASTILAEDTRFENGILAAKGAHVVQYHGSLAIISKTAEDYRDPVSGRLIPKGSRVSFHSGQVIDARPAE
ncbi:MAG TPA: hypothetical protein VN132_01545 [Bdellovibrio sp.]|nr:hypothetical protein [Bdellovibrio sp.]